MPTLQEMQHAANQLPPLLGLVLPKDVSFIVIIGAHPEGGAQHFACVSNIPNEHVHDAILQYLRASGMVVEEEDEKEEEAAQVAHVDKAQTRDEPPP